MILALSLAIVAVAHATQNQPSQLRGQNLNPEPLKLLAVLGQSSDKCTCNFDDACTCHGAITFMNCIKEACKSPHCKCTDDGTNHFLESCGQMNSTCPGIGLKCTKKQAQCTDEKDGFIWKIGQDWPKIRAEPIPGHKKEEEEGKGKKESDEQDEKANAKQYVTKAKHESVVKEVQSHGHHVFAFGTMVTIILLSVTIALASSATALVRKHAWSMIDFVVVTFIATAWFHVVMGGLDFFGLRGYVKVLVHAALALCFLLAAIFGSWSLRNDNYKFSIFTSLATPMVMWCSTGYAETVQKNYVPSILYVALTLASLAIWYAMLSALLYYKVAPKSGWGSEIEAGVYGGSLAGGFVLFLHMIINGSYHTIDPPHGEPPSMFSAIITLVLSVLFVGTATVCTPMLSKRKEKEQSSGAGYWPVFFIDVLSHFIGKLPHFSVIMSLASLLIGRMDYPPGSSMDRLVLAVVSSVIGILMIYMCAYVPKLSGDTGDALQLRGIFLSLGGLVAAVPWVNLMTHSINEMSKGKGYDDPFVYKIFITGLISVFVFPVYILYVKPVVMLKE